MMKKASFLFILLLSIMVMSCNNSEKNELILANEYSYPLINSETEDLKGGILKCNNIEKFNQFVNSMALNIEDEIVALIYYADSKIATSDDILTEKGKDIKFVSIFTLNNGKLRHNLLERKSEKQYSSIDEFDLSCNSVSTNTARFMLSWVKGKNISNQDINSYRVIMSPEAKKSRIMESVNELVLKTRVYNYKKYGLISRHKDPNPSAGCDECEDNGCECEIKIDIDDDGFNPSLDPYICKECCTQNRAKYEPDVTNHFSEGYINMYYDNDLYWDFKDNIMDNSDIGIKYINYYRGLSAFILTSGDLTASHLISTTSKMPSIHSIVTKFLSQSTLGTDIVIDTNIERDLKDLIHLYRDFSTNTDFQFILDDIENDIDLFSGKTYSEVLALIQ